MNFENMSSAEALENLTGSKEDIKLKEHKKEDNEKEDNKKEDNEKEDNKKEDE